MARPYAARRGRAGFGQGANQLPGVRRRRGGIPDSFHRGFAPGLRAAAKAAQPPAAKPGLGAAPKAPAQTAPGPVGQHAAPDSLYQAQISLANAKQEQQLNSLQGQENRTKFDFGIGDPTNPFSRAEGLKRSFLAQRKAASANLASEGQLYSGAHERALARTRFNEEQARAELRSAFDQAMGQIDQARSGIKFDTEEQRNQAFEDWLARAPEAQDTLAQADAAAGATTGAKPAAKVPGPSTTPPGAAGKAQVVAGSGQVGNGAQALLAGVTGTTAAKPAKPGHRPKVHPKPRPKARPKAAHRHRARQYSAGVVGRGGFGGRRRHH